MRTVTPQAQVLLSQNMGTEWIVLLEVDWVDNGTLVYSDQAFEKARDVILDLGGFDGSMMLTGSADTQQLSVTLDDIDGHLRAIYNTNDMHKRPARVYLQPKTLSSQHKILVFLGEIVTPLEWDESQRTLKFNIMSKLNAQQVGFSMEEGDFPNIPDEALGKAWPLVFGQVCHLPAVKVRAPRRGYLEGGVGIKDFTLEPRICQAVKIQCPSQSTGNMTAYQSEPNGGLSAVVSKTVGPDLECLNRRFGEICKLRDLKTQQEAYEYTTISVYNGTSFPQNQKIVIYIDDAKFTGSFSGNTFTITNREHPDYATFNHVACRNVPSFGYGAVATAATIGGTNNTSSGAGGGWLVKGSGGGAAGQNTSAVWQPNSTFTGFSASQNTAQAFASCDEALKATPGMIGGPVDSWKYYDEMEAASFFWAPAGSEVYMESESELLYIASLLPGTVDGVAAYRTAPNGVSYLTEVPASYYTVYETDYQGYQVVEIGLDRQLSTHNDQWQDDIYVSFTSSVGPNPCDIIEWLIEKYTDLSVDATTFAAVHALTANYPTNFYITSRPDVYSLINDIAYQSRCAVYVRNNVMYIKYLPLEPTSVRTLTEADILSGTFVESLSETEEVYTTHNITWRPSGASVRDNQDVDRKLVLKYNVDKYGTVDQDWDYYTYNIYELILKSATFWLIRKANSWKKLAFTLPIKHMDLDVLDCVTIDVDQFGSATKCIIESMTIDPASNTVSVVCWTPIRSGETEPYFWAWPSQQPCASVWPLPLDTHGGGGYNFTVTPPVGHLLLGGYHRDDQLIISSGDLHPSDLCDTLPSLSCELSDYINFNEIDPIIEIKNIAQQAARQAMETNMSGGGNSGGGGGEKPEPETQGTCPSGVGCNYNVVLNWHTSAAQGQATALGPGAPHACDKCGGPCRCRGGCPSCYGKSWNVCHTFGSAGAAKAFASYQAANRYRDTAHQGCWWECGETRLYSAPKANNGAYVQMTPGVGSFTDECQDINDAVPWVDYDSATHGSGESTKPSGTTGDEPGTDTKQITINPYTGDADYRAPGYQANDGVIESVQSNTGEPSGVVINPAYTPN